MVYGFVKQSAGHIKLYSELGQGTSIKIYLPRVQGTPSEAQTDYDSTICSIGDKSKMILIVKNEFIANKVGDILTITQMDERLSQLVLLSEEKIRTAETYALKRWASEIGENLHQWPESHVELCRIIQEKRRNRNSNCILVIEDDILMRGLLESMLEDKYPAVLAKNAATGITAYIDHAPNVVFLDILLPDLDGMEVLKRLKQLDPQAYIVMLSGYSSPNNVTSTHTQGAAGFLCKPFAKERLYDFIKECPTMDIATI